MRRELTEFAIDLLDGRFDLFDQVLRLDLVDRDVELIIEIGERDEEEGRLLEKLDVVRRIGRSRGRVESARRRRCLDEFEQERQQRLGQ